jgi:hypothetical protein
MITVEYEAGYNKRTAIIKYDGHEVARVTQDSAYPDWLLTDPSLDYGGSSNKSREWAEIFIKCLQKMLQIQKRWRKDVGKDPKSIKLIRNYMKEYDAFRKRKPFVAYI